MTTDIYSTFPLPSIQPDSVATHPHYLSRHTPTCFPTASWATPPAATTGVQSNEQPPQITRWLRTTRARRSAGIHPQRSPTGVPPTERHRNQDDSRSIIRQMGIPDAVPQRTTLPTTSTLGSYDHNSVTHDPIQPRRPAGRLPQRPPTGAQVTTTFTLEASWVTPPAAPTRQHHNLLTPLSLCTTQLHPSNQTRRRDTADG